MIISFLRGVIRRKSSGEISVFSNTRLLEHKWVKSPWERWRKICHLSDLFKIKSITSPCTMFYSSLSVDRNERLHRICTYVSPLLHISVQCWADEGHTGSYWLKPLIWGHEWGWIDILTVTEAACQGARERGPYARQADNRVIFIDLYPQWTLTVLHHWCLFLFFFFWITPKHEPLFFHIWK